MSLEVGSIVSGKVSGITGFGAFIDLPGNITGLAHISEVAREYVKDINEYLKEGQEVKVKVISIDQGGKISLSIKRALEESEKKQRGTPAQIDWSAKSEPSLSFEDKLSRFKQDSDERMQALKRNTESKRGGYRRAGGSY